MFLTAARKNVLFYSLSPPWDVIILFIMFLNLTGKKCYLIVFYSLNFLRKTGHSYKEALDCHHILKHHANGPLITPWSLDCWLTHYIKMLTDFPAIGGFCQNIILANFHPKYQQPSSFWKEGKRSHQINSLRDESGQQEHFCFILLGFVKFRFSDWRGMGKPINWPEDWL